MNLTEYYGQPGDGEMAVVLGTEIMEERALMSRRSDISST